MVEYRKIQCNQCGLKLIDADPEKHIGIQVQEAGGVYKIPILFGGKEPLYFCNEECKHNYYVENFSQEVRDKANDIAKDLRANMPKMVEDTQKAMQNLISGIKEVSKILKNLTWVEVEEENYDTYPKEGETVVVTDGSGLYSLAYFLMSSEYVWMKEDKENDTANIFKEFDVKAWAYIKN